MDPKTNYCSYFIKHERKVWEYSWALCTEEILFRLPSLPTKVYNLFCLIILLFFPYKEVNLKFWLESKSKKSKKQNKTKLANRNSEHIRKQKASSQAAERLWYVHLSWKSLSSRTQLNFSMKCGWWTPTSMKQTHNSRQSKDTWLFA